MLCRVCIGLLRAGSGVMWAGTHDLTFEHHKTTTTLRRSREAGCSICIALANVLRPELDLLEDRSISIRASLRKISSDQVDLGPDDQPSGNNFRLDFELERKHARVFLLKETSN